MSDLLEPLDQSLRHGNVPAALTAAKAYAKAHKSDGREAGIAIAKTVGTVYRDLIADPVHEFVQGADALGSEIGPLVQKAVGRLITMTEEWEPKLRSVYEERLARELRNAVRAKDWHTAVEHVRELCRPAAEAGDVEEVRQRALYTGNVLGTLLNQPKEADYLLRLVRKDPETYGLTAELADQMKIAKDDRHSKMMGANIENLENQWTQQLKDAQVTVLQAMPGKNKMGEPEEADLRTVGDLFRTVLRVPIWLQEPDLLTDATLILTDFIPKETASTAKAAGIEGRSYAEMGYTAKKATAMVFMEIGQNAFFTRLYRQWAQDQLAGPHASAIVEFMGALRCDEYSDFFMALSRNKELRSEAATALGNLASAEAADTLLEELRAIIGKVGKKRLDINNFRMTENVLDPKTLADATRILAGLGRIVRSPRTEEKQRVQVIQEVISLTPENVQPLVAAAVTEVVSAKADALDAKQRRWAIDALVEALWIQDQSTEMHKGGERQANILGTRAPMAKSLVRLGKEDVDYTLEALEKKSARYSGAFLAVAEVLENLESEKALGLIDKMILTALMHEDQGNAYKQETYWDATSQTRKPLTRDVVVAPLIEAAAAVGGSQAEDLLGRIQSQIASGRMRSPGPETQKTLAKHLKPEKAKEKGAGAAAEAEQAPDGELPMAEVRKLNKALSASYLLKGASKRRLAKIDALRRAGVHTPLESIDAVFENLGDKDQMVVNAAIGTLQEYTDPKQPGYKRDEVVEKALLLFEHKSAAMRGAAPKLLKAIGPARPEVKSKLVEFVKSTDSADVKHRLRLALKTAQVEGGLVTDEEPDNEGGPGGGGGGIGGVSALELKRQYMQERQAWIRGGKKGPPPEPPEGV
ncbi:MAG: hypothetical protein RLY93_13565 [Sumerlaeia bacterium]